MGDRVPLPGPVGDRPGPGTPEVVGPDQLEPRLGTDLPVLGFVPDPVFQLVRWVGLGGWITLYATLGPHGLWWIGFLAMWAWIALEVAHDNQARRRRRLRRHYRRALRTGQVVLALPEPGPAARRGAVVSRLSQVSPARGPLPRTGSAEAALAATVARVEAGGRLTTPERALVHEVADLLAPLLRRVAERGADPQVRHDLETLAAEHLPRTVDDFLSLPDDVARGHRDGRGLTPADELRNQLNLLVEGCRRLREAVLAADVDRQRQQSRFLETKFRGSDLDL